MKLTTANLAPFIGGQVEISRPGHEFCGEIRELVIVDGDIYIAFAWLAMKEGSEWVGSPHSEYQVPVNSVEKIGPSANGNEDRVELQCTCPNNGESVRMVLNPPSSNMLRQDQVKNLLLVPA